MPVRLIDVLHIYDHLVKNKIEGPDLNVFMFYFLQIEMPVAVCVERIY